MSTGQIMQQDNSASFSAPSYQAQRHLLKNRLPILLAGLNSDDSNRQLLAIKGYSSALQSGHYSRISGVERQGSRAPQQEYRPATYNEIWEYWKACLDTLAETACKGIQVQLIRDEFASKLGGVLSGGSYQYAIDATKKILECTGSPWPEALDRVQWALTYGLKSAPNKIKKAVESLREDLLPSALREELNLYITNRFLSRKGFQEHAEFIDDKATELARKTIEKRGEWGTLFESLSTEEQINGVLFGYKLGVEAVNNDLVKGVLESALNAFLRAEVNTRNVSLVAGIAKAVGEEGAEKAKQILLKDNGLLPHYVILLSVIGLRLSDLESLLNLSKSGDLNQEMLRSLSWGCPLAGVSQSEVSTFINSLGELRGFSSSAFVLASNWKACFKNDNSKEEINHSLRKLLMKNELALDFIRHRQSDLHYWFMEANELLKSNDNELATSLTHTVIQQYRSDRLAGPPHEVDMMLQLLLKNFTSISWPMLGENMLEDRSFFFRLAISAGGINFGTPRDKDGGGHIITSSVPEDILINWIRENGNDAAAMIAQITRLFEPGSSPTWNPIVTTILNEFGTVPEVLSALSNNLFSFGSVGSRTPYYLTRITLLKQLKDHPLSAVRNWAFKQIEKCELSAKNETTRDEERDLGIW